MSKTKIICTIGPACQSSQRIREMAEAGMDVARLNFSHGDRKTHLDHIKLVRQAASELKRPIAIMGDLQGAKMRIGQVRTGRIILAKGDQIYLTPEDVNGTKEKVSVNYENLARDVKKDDRILLADGTIELLVLASHGQEVLCEVTNGGELASRAGLSLTGFSADIPVVTSKDLVDIRFGIEEGIDYLAMSFVRLAQDIKRLKDILEESGADIPVIAKIETSQALASLDEILKLADGVMIARGDLGVENPPENVPLVQKDIIRRCNNLGIPVITATQMLRSMVWEPRPTRAEASDIANAILDGTDALMLSEETAIGGWPLKAVEMMSRIAGRTEETLDYEEILRSREISSSMNQIPEAISHATCRIAQGLNVDAIITFTISGQTPRLVSKYRPKASIIGMTTSESTYRRLCLYWGVRPLKISQIKDTDHMFLQAQAEALKAGVIKRGDTIVVTAGLPIEVRGTTNILRVMVVD